MTIISSEIVEYDEYLKVLYDRLYLVESEGTYKVAFENDSKTYKDILSPTNTGICTSKRTQNLLCP